MASAHIKAEEVLEEPRRANRLANEKVALLASARRIPGGMVSLGEGGVRQSAIAKTNPFFSRSVIPPVTGATFMAHESFEDAATAEINESRVW